jgi:hypothetical protein
MKTAFAALALVAVAAPAAAEPKHSGTYKIDPKRMNFSDGTTPPTMSLTVSMTITPDRLRYRSVNDTMKDRAPYVSEFDAPLDDTPAPFPNQQRFNFVRIKKLSANEYRIMKMKDDDVISGEVWTFQPNGKEVVRRGVTKNPQNHSHFYDEWFVRTAG